MPRDVVFSVGWSSVCIYGVVFPFLRSETRGVTGPVRGCLRMHVYAKTFRRRRDDDLRA